MIIEDDGFLKQDQMDFVNNIVLQPFFPYFYTPHTVDIGDNLGTLNHILIRRPEDRKPDEPIHNSDYTQKFVEIFDTFCKKNNIKYKEILRACVNLTFWNGLDKCEIHRDHNYKHKQLLIYLNQPLDRNSYTVILDESGKKIKMVKPKQFRGVCWDGNDHYHHFPKEGARIVAIYTFNE